MRENRGVAIDRRFMRSVWDGGENEEVNEEEVDEKVEESPFV